jgi:hypothetical protein
VRGNLSFTYPLEQRARLHLQVLRSFNCGKPFGFHVSLFSRSGNVGSRRLRGRLCRALSRKRTRFLHMVAAITFTDLLEDVPRTLPEPPFDFRRAPRHCKFPTPTPRSLPVTKSIRAIHRTLLTAACLASLKKSHVCARHLLSFAASLSVPLPELPQPAHSISPCTPREQLD